MKNMLFLSDVKIDIVIEYDIASIVCDMFRNAQIIDIKESDAIIRMKWNSVDSAYLGIILDLVRSAIKQINDAPTG